MLLQKVNKIKRIFKRLKILFLYILKLVISMKVRLGYVAIPLTIAETASKTITYTNYLKLTDKKDYRLDEIIRQNLISLYHILLYNKRNNIHFYRMTSHLIPLATLKEVHFDYLTPYLSQYEKISSLLKLSQMRVDMHPDQYVVLNSMNPSIVENSIVILEYHQSLLEIMKVSNPKLVLHVGSSQGGKKASMTRFKKNFLRLNPRLQKMILIENDDKIYDVEDVLSLCESLDVPMVLDYHHFLCNNREEFIQKYLQRIVNTWKKEKLPPKIHFSSPKHHTKKDFRSHHDFIEVDQFIHFLEIAKEYFTDLDVMIEAKQKDFALFKLIRELKYRTNYLFLDDTTFIVP